jgi:hypothetical protein
LPVPSCLSALSFNGPLFQERAQDTIPTTSTIG